MSFQRTRLSADRTLMSVMRTSLSLIGFGYHVAFMVELRKERDQMKAEGLVHAKSGFPVSLTLIVALLLLTLGFMAIGTMTFNLELFG